MVLGGTGSVGGGTGWYLVVLGQYRSVLIDTWWYWVNMERYWLIYDGTGSAEGGTVRFLVVLGQKKSGLGQYNAARAESIWMSG